MRSKSWVLAFLLLLLPAAVVAQEETRRGLVLPLPNGGFVGFKSETAWTGADSTSASMSAAAKELKGELRSQAFVDDGRAIHRVLVDAAGKYVFGYDLLIEAVPASKTFTIAVKPLDSQVENKLLASSSESQHARIATLPQSAEPQILDDGDSFALDLLVNQKTGVKIVDLVKVSFDRSNLWEENPKSLPRDFTLDAVALTVVEYRLLIDGNLIAAGKPGTNFAGALIWCYVEGHGRFIFSLVPREGYPFQKVGIVRDNRIEFTVKGKHYEWLSSAPILSSGGSWNLWVLHDPKYRPFGSAQVSKQEKSRLDKLDDSIRAAQDRAAKIGDSMPSTFRKKPEIQEGDGHPGQEGATRFRVMVGAADRIENLLPK